jgi:hypothetical protein
MKLIGAALLMLSLASAGMAVTTTLATAHPQAAPQAIPQLIAER